MAIENNKGPIILGWVVAAGLLIASAAYFAVTTQFEEMFAQSRDELPLVTRAVLAGKWLWLITAAGGLWGALQVQVGSRRKGWCFILPSAVLVLVGLPVLVLGFYAPIL